MMSTESKAEGKDERAYRFRRYAPELGYILEGARVGGWDDKLFAESLEAALRGGSHSST